MKKHLSAIIIIGITFIFAIAEEFKSYNHSFFGVYGKNGSVMGHVQGPEFEVWIYPYKVLHQLNTRVIVEGSQEEVYPNLSGFTICPEFICRTFIGEQWILEQQVFPAMNKPLVFLVNRIQVFTDIRLVFEFVPDLSPMWPASLGGKYSYWDPQGYFVLSESSNKNFALFGGSPGEKIGQLPAHSLPEGKLRYQIDLKTGSHVIPLVVAAGNGKLETVKKFFTAAIGQHENYLSARTEHINHFFSNHLQLATPVEKFNRALKWAIWNVNSAFVDNPDLGEGLIAGYGLSGETERPGFGWYFGGDGLINSFALVNYGDFEGARKEIEFLLKYQREDGKIMHELSQGAAFINWFKDYGFPYFHGDTTLYFLTFLDFYVKRTGDTGILSTFKDKVLKSYSWLQSCDEDRDGIVETNQAGTGASETGPLRQKMKTDIFLAALSVKAWQAMENILGLLGDHRGKTVASSKGKQARHALETMFWNEKNQFYAYAVREDDSQINEVTIWPAIAMRFRAMDPSNGRIAQKKIASPQLSTDWGTRFLSSHSRFYDPVSYNNGAVWPFLTGFSSLAMYQYDNPYHGFSLLKANLNIIMDYDFGSPAELLAGNLYRPLDESVPNQIWSSGNTISSFVEGLLGFDADIPDKNIVLKPAIPLIWKHLQVKNLKAGPGKLNMIYTRDRGRVKIKIHPSKLRGFHIDFQPRIPTLKKSVKVNGHIVHDWPIKLDCRTQAVKILIDLKGYIYPDIPKNLPYGKQPDEPIIEDLRLESDSFALTMWGKGNVKIPLMSDLKFKCSQGTQEKNGEITILTVHFGNGWRKKTIVGHIIN